MSFIGTGDQDWVELDLDLFERRRLSRLREVLDQDRQRIGRAIGSDFEVEIDEVGNAYLVVDGQRRFLAEINHADRLLLTGILDPDGPL